ncbi:MAG: putative RNA-binding Zn ribbon-like protein [Acidimicrobiales bacterium]|jgi:predicted RNA-binding Zn ribbon-like protein
MEAATENVRSFTNLISPGLDDDVTDRVNAALHPTRVQFGDRHDRVRSCEHDKCMLWFP